MRVEDVRTFHLCDHSDYYREWHMFQMCPSSIASFNSGIFVCIIILFHGSQD